MPGRCGRGGVTLGQGLAASASHRVLGGDRGTGSGISGPWAEGRARFPLTRRSGLSRGCRSGWGWLPGSGGCRLLHPPWPGPAASRRRVSGPRAASRRRRGPWSGAAPGGQGGAGRPGRPTEPRTVGPQCRRLPPALRRLGGAGSAGAPARAPPRPPPPARPHPPRASHARSRPRPSAMERGDGGGTRPEKSGRNQAHPKRCIRGPDWGGCGWVRPVSGEPGLGWRRNLAKDKSLEVRPTGAGRLGICQLIDGSMIKGRPGSSRGGC